MLGCFQHTPWSGSSSPVSSLTMVDLPAPLGPRMAIRLLRLHWMVTPSRIWRVVLG